MVAILFILLFVMAVRVPTDTDTWWHIRSGEYIVENREIPKTDPFSHTRYGEDWIDHSWGSQIVIYGVYDLFGGGRAAGRQRQYRAGAVHGRAGDAGHGVRVPDV